MQRFQMSYKILDLYRDLPRTNCRDCGRTSCFSLAGAIFLEGASIGACTHLGTESIRDIEQKIQTGKRSNQRNGSTPDERSIAALFDELSTRDLAEVARNTGAVLSPGTPRTLHLEVFGCRHLVFREGATQPKDSLGTRASFFVLNHLVRSRSTVPTGEWVSYWELSEAAGALRSFRSCVGRLESAFSGRVDDLVRAARTLNARAGEPGSASVCLVFDALPHVALRLKFWDRAEDEEARANVLHPEYGRFTSALDFDARAEMQVDERVLDQLDPEALLYLIAQLVDDLLGSESGFVSEP